MFELEQQLLDKYLSKQDKGKQQQFLSSYKQLPEDEKEAILMELNSLYGLQSNQQQQGLNFAPQAQPQYKNGGRSKYQSGGRKAQIAKLQRSLADHGYDLSKSKKKSGKYDGIVGTNTTNAINTYADKYNVSKAEAISALTGGGSESDFILKATDYFDKNPRARATSKKTQKALASLPVQQAQSYDPTEVALRETSREYNRATLPTVTVNASKPEVYENVPNLYNKESLQMYNATGIAPAYFNANNNGYVPQRTQPQSNYMNPYAAMQQAPVDPQQYAQYIDGLKNYVMPAVSMAIPFEGAMAYGLGKLGSSVAKAAPRINNPVNQIPSLDNIRRAQNSMPQYNLPNSRPMSTLPDDYYTRLPQQPQMLLPPGRNNNPYFNGDDLTGLTAEQLRQLRMQGSRLQGSATRILNR